MFEITQTHRRDRISTTSIVATKRDVEAAYRFYRLSGDWQSFGFSWREIAA